MAVFSLFHRVGFAFVVLVMAGRLPANAAQSTNAPPTPEQQIRLTEHLAPSVVQVEHWLQHDGSEAPSGGWGERCPNCGRIHGNPLESLIRDERPLRTAGFVVAPDRIVTPDIQVHSRFVREIRVRKGERSVPARLAGLALERNASFLALDEPLPGIQPLAFDAAKSAPYLAVVYTGGEGAWSFHVQPLAGAVTVPDDRPPFLAAPSYAALLAADGTPVGLSMTEELPTDESWKGSPLAWPAIAAEELRERLEKLEQRAEAALVRVSLGLRSPRAAPGSGFRGRFHHSGEDESAAQRDALGLRIGADRLLILAGLSPRVTARLEQIHWMNVDGTERTLAEFSGSFRDIGALLAATDKPAPGEGLELCERDINVWRSRLLLAGDISVQGEQRIARFSHARISAFSHGWRERLYPDLPGRSQNLFLFDLDGRLIALPLARRDSGTERRYSFSRAVLTPTAYALGLLAALDAELDPANVPLSEEEENRLAWLGVELQPLGRELARANRVADQTQDGRTGALVTFVHPDSPAARAGIEPGMILLRLRVPGRPQPLAVQVDDGSHMSRSFPWDRLDDLPEQYFDQIPAPWPSAETGFSRMLTDLGLGTEITAEFFQDGRQTDKPFVLEAGPPHFESAPRFASESLGLTVRNTTYEVRNYLQRKDGEPGVVISRVEPGGRASVAGIKPYELITHVNGEPVPDVGAFEKLTGADGRLSLSVKRMAAGRLVAIAVAD